LTVIRCRAIIGRLSAISTAGSKPNPSATYPQISNHDDTPIDVTDSVIE